MSQASQRVLVQKNTVIWKKFILNAKIVHFIGKVVHFCDKFGNLILEFIHLNRKLRFMIGKNISLRSSLWRKITNWRYEGLWLLDRERNQKASYKTLRLPKCWAPMIGPN